MVEVVAENTIGERVNRVFERCERLENLKEFRMLEGLRAVKEISRGSELVKNFVEKMIKPLMRRYYREFECQ
jgi:hypothetical protein